jgi:aspartyl-tRNA(Asn)/glutamyl-tRNA(Gln) amidotransferase subunit A
LCERFDTIGPHANSVEDCAHLHAALHGAAPVDLAGASLAGARLAILETVVLDDLRDRPAQGFDDAVARLSRAGARIERMSAPEVTDVLGLAGILSSVEAYAIWRDTIEASPEKMFPRILDRFRSATQFTGIDYVTAWRRMQAIRAIWADRVAAFDAILLPTAPILPPDANRLLTDDAYYVSENLLALRNTRIGSLMGVCALTLPTSQPSCGISLMAGAGQEARLLRLGAAAEHALR